MTDLLNVQKDRKRKCVLVCQIIREFFPHTTRDQAPTWLLRYRTCNPPPAVLLPVRTAGTRNALRSFRAERRLFTKAFTCNSTNTTSNNSSNNSNSRTTTKTRFSQIHHRYRITELASLKKTMAIAKTAMSSSRANDIETVTMILRSPTEIFDDYPKNMLTSPKTRIIRKCFTHLMRNCPPDVSIPYHQIIFRYLYRLLKEINRCHISMQSRHGM